MVIKNKNLNLLAKILFCTLSIYPIILLCHYLMWAVADISSDFVSPTSYFFAFTGFHLDNNIVYPFLEQLHGVPLYIFQYIWYIFSDIWYTMSVTIYSFLYAMLAQKFFFGDVLKKEYYKPKNFFNIYIKLLLVSRLFSPIVMMLLPASANYRNAPFWGYIEVYGLLTVFLVYKAIGLARKKSQQTVLV